MKVNIGGKYKSKDAKAILAFVMDANGEIAVIEAGKKSSKEKDGVDIRSCAICECVDFMRSNGMKESEIIASLMAAVIL